MVKGRLEVLLVDAQGLKDRDSEVLGCLFCLNLCNAIKLCPYVVIHYGDQESTSHVANQKKGEEKKLEWNETITFDDVEYDPDAEGKIYKLVLQIFDKHKISDDDLVGESTGRVRTSFNLKMAPEECYSLSQIAGLHEMIYIKDVLSLGAEKGREELRAQKYRVVLPDNTYSGEISVAVTFTLNE